MRFRPYAIAVLASFGDSSSKSVTANSIEEPSKKAVRDAEETLRDAPWWTRTTYLPRRLATRQGASFPPSS